MDDQVQSFLQKNNLADYLSRFFDNNVEYSMLVELVKPEHQFLLSQLVGDQIKFKKGIEEIENENSRPTASSSLSLPPDFLSTSFSVLNGIGSFDDNFGAPDDNYGRNLATCSGSTNGLDTSKPSDNEQLDNAEVEFSPTAPKTAHNESLDSIAEESYLNEPTTTQSIPPDNTEAGSRVQTSKEGETNDDIHFSEDGTDDEDCVLPRAVTKNDIVDLETILKESNDGKNILKNKEKRLNCTLKKKLIQIIVSFYHSKDLRLNNAACQIISADIENFFKKEKQTTYYTPPFKYNKIEKKSTGPLIEKVRNDASKKIREGIWKKQRGKKRKSDGNSAQQEKPKKTKEAYKCGPEEEAHKNYLRFSAGPWSEVQRRWALSFNIRSSDVNNEENDVESIIKLWPAMQLEKGYELINHDFSIKYPDQHGLLMETWPDFKRKVIQYCEESSDVSKDFLDFLKNEEKPEVFERPINPSDTLLYVIMYFEQQLEQFGLPKVLINAVLNDCVKQFLIFRLLQQFCPPTARILQKNGKYGKVTTAESKTGFLGIIDDPNKLNEKLEQKKKWALDHRVHFQPFLVIEGMNLEHINPNLMIIKNVYLAYKNIIYRFPDVLNALDASVKLHFFFQLKYCKSCEQIYTFIQIFLYKITTESDTVNRYVKELIQYFEDLAIENEK